MATLIPRPPYSPEELSQLYPKGLSLEQVQVIFRHGERTPINARFMNAGVPPFWNFCKTAKHFRAAVIESPTDIWGHLQYERGIETIGPNGIAQLTKSRHGDEEGICLFGELTDVGRATTLALGARLRHLYIDQLSFLDSTLTDGSKFYLRSSPVVRAQESLHQVFTGLYPPTTRTLTHPPTIHLRNASDENLYPNENNCRRLLQLARSFAELSSTKWNDSPEMAYVQSKIGRYLDGPAAIDGHPRLSGIQDHINSTLAHDSSVHLPAEFYDEKVRAHIETMTVDEWFRGYTQSSEYRRLGVGNLLANIKDRMFDSVASPDSVPKFALMGCHDTTIAAALASLGAYDKKWPPFTSSIAFEVFKAVDGGDGGEKKVRKWGWDSWFGRKGVSADGYYVRLRYNETPVVLRGCRAKGKHLEGDESMCTLEAFQNIVDKISPPDWKAECVANLDKPGIPPVEELED